MQHLSCWSQIPLALAAVSWLWQTSSRWAMPNSTSPWVTALHFYSCSVQPLQQPPKWLRCDFNDILLAPFCVQLQARGRVPNASTSSPSKGEIWGRCRQRVDDGPRAAWSLWATSEIVLLVPSSSFLNSSPKEEAQSSSREECRSQTSSPAALEMSIWVSFPI